MSFSILYAASNETRWEIEYRIITTAGETKWVAETGVGIYSQDAQLEYLDGFIQDITARKKWS